MILYSKFSNERSPRFSICTQIVEEEGLKKVRKFAVADEAADHVGRLFDSYQKLKTIYAASRFEPNVCRMTDRGAEFEFLNGSNLNDDLLAVKDRPEELKARLLEFFDQLDRTADTTFDIGEDFAGVFGVQPLKEGLPAASVCNIDTLPDNVLVCGDVWNVIDYEWTLPFSIPIQYVKWRTLHYFGHRNVCDELLRSLDLYESAGIRTEDERIFESMEKQFQNYVEGDRVPLRNQYRLVSPGFDLLDKHTGDLIPEERNYVLIVGNNEDGPVTYRRELTDGLLIYEAILSGADRVDIYPSAGPQIITEFSVNIDDRPLYLDSAEFNGRAVDEGTLIFQTDRPCISYKVPKDGWKFHIHMKCAPLNYEGARILLERLPKKSAAAEVFCDSGSGFQPDQAKKVLLDANGDGKIVLPLEGICGVRLDPSDFPCYVRIDAISTDLGKVDLSLARINGYVYQGNRCIFTREDPNIVVDQSMWEAGSRIFSVHFHVEDLSEETAELFCREIEPLEKMAAFQERKDRHHLAMLDERDRLLKNLSGLKAMKAYRQYLRLRRRPDPFKSLRVQVENRTSDGGIDQSGIYASADDTIYRKEVCVFRGWAFDREDPIFRIRLMGETGREIQADFMRKIRDDVNEIYQLDPKFQAGFNLTVRYADIREEDLPLQLEFESRRGFLRLPAAYEADPEKRESEKLVREHDYNDWYEAHKASEEELKRQRRETFDPAPLFSIVVPLYRTREHDLRVLVDSILTQTYTNWELILSDGSGEDSPLDGILTELEERDRRIHAVRNGKKLRISANTNEAIKAAGGDYIVFCDHDDRLTPDALYENAKMIREHPEAELIYSDEDKMLDDGSTLTDPNFKPDFSYDLLLSNNYICHLTVVKRTLLDRAGLLNERFDGSQDYDLVLRCCEEAEDLTRPGSRGHIRHIPKVLYHWRISETSTAADAGEKGYAPVSGREALQAHLDRMGIPGRVRDGLMPGFFKIDYEWEEEPLVSIIIPNKDHTDDLDKCLNSIIGRTNYSNYEIIVVENNSEEAAAFAYYNRLKIEHPEVRVVTYKGAFNYSAINNLGVKESKGDYLLFLNNDTSFIRKDGIRQLLGICMRGDVGAVGARLYYDDDTIQHAGVVIGLSGIAGHAFSRLERSNAGYMGRVFSTQDLSAVTAACMMVKRSVFEEVEGFNTELSVAFNDVDFCMKIRSHGYRIVYNPEAELYHYESKSRGYENTPSKVARFEREVTCFKQSWPEILKEGDPYYNPNLSLKLGGYRLKDDDE